MKLFGGFTAFICWLLMAVQGLGQTKQNLLFKHLDQEAGLSDPNVKAILMDTDGFLWIGTENGLNRFDGTTCTTFKNSKGNANNMPGNYITNIIEDKLGNLIIGSQSNLVKYNKAKDVFTTYRFNHHEDLKTTFYSFPFFIDDREALWVYLAGNVYRYDSASKKLTYVTTYSNGHIFPYGFFYKPLKWFISRGVNGIYINQANDLKETQVTDFFMKPNSPSGPISYIEDAYLVSDSLVWLAGDSGLIRLNPKTKQIRKFNQYQQFKNLNCTAVKKYPGKPWLLVGTRYNGLLLFDLSTEQFIAQYAHQPNDATSLSGNYVRKIYIDQNQNLFVAIDGHGLDYTNLNKAIFSRFCINDHLGAGETEQNITAILKDQKDQIWCGTKNSGLMIYDPELKQELKHEFMGFGINKLFALPDHNILIELSTGNFFLYNSMEKRFKSLKITTSKPYHTKIQVSQLLNFQDKGIFAATNSGLAKVQLKNEKEISFNFQDNINHLMDWPNVQYVIPLSKHKVLMQTYYTSMYLFDLDPGHPMVSKEISRTPFATNGHYRIGNLIYLATTAGLYVYDCKANAMGKESLLDANCSSIIPDADNRLWIGTNSGLFVYNPKTRAVSSYSTLDGLQSMVFNPNSIARIGNQIAIGGTNGINKFDPRKTTAYLSSSTPKITTILVNDKPYTAAGNPVITTEINLKHSENTLSFGLSTMDYIDPKKRKMSYRMVGYDDKMLVLVGNNRIRYPNMPPGTFRLELIDVESNKKTMLKITIASPFWTKWWFISVLVVSTALLAWLILFLYLRWVKHLQVLQLRQMINFQKADRKRIANDLHDDLGLKLSSLKHYLLAGEINKMIDSGELRRLSTEYIDGAVAVLRTTLINLSPKTLDENGLIVALEDLIESISRLKIINIHFDHAGFTTTLKSAHQYALYRSCQELINNTIKHAQAKNIYLSIINRGDKLILLYEDDGKSFDYETVRRGYGLSNIEAHIRAIKADMEIDAAPGKGTAVTISIYLRAQTKSENND